MLRAFQRWKKQTDKLILETKSSKKKKKVTSTLQTKWEKVANKNSYFQDTFNDIIKNGLSP